MVLYSIIGRSFSCVVFVVQKLACSSQCEVVIELGK